jgi:hypothetical protein
MPDNDSDPGASTQMFRAFVERDENTGAAAETGSKRLLVVGLVVAVVVAAVIAFLVL